MSVDDMHARQSYVYTTTDSSDVYTYGPDTQALDSTSAYTHMPYTQSALRDVDPSRPAYTHTLQERRSSCTRRHKSVCYGDAD